MVCDQSQCVFTDRLPELQRIARSAFRHLAPDNRDEAIQNTIALAWKQYRALVVRGRRDADQLLGSILWYSIQQTKCGRLMQGCPSAKDLFQRHRRGESFIEDIDVHDLMGRSTPVLEAVSFRMDLPRLFASLSDRQQETARLLASGFTTSEVAELIGVTPAAVSQFRARFKVLYDEFYAVA